jgi:hypothetical protein
MAVDYSDEKVQSDLQAHSESTLWSMFSLGWDMVMKKKKNSPSRAKDKNAAWRKFLESLSPGPTTEP